MERHLPFYEGKYYHIYNRGNNGENLFYKEENYLYFLKKYDLYLGKYLNTYAYSLMPNHFHLMVEVKGLNGNPEPLKKGMATLVSVEEIISEQFRRLFTSYSKSVNKQEERYGSLFQKNFKRKEVVNDSYYTRLIYYIHANPQLHGICSDFRQYPYSSYRSMLSDSSTKLMRKEVLDWFGGKEGIIKFHAEMVLDNLGELALE